MAEAGTEVITEAVITVAAPTPLEEALAADFPVAVEVLEAAAPRGDGDNDVSE